MFPLLQVDPVATAGLLALVVVVVAAWQSVVVVEETDRVVLTVRGERRGVLEPGLHLVPPFVSRTRSVDVRTRSRALSELVATTRDDRRVTVDAAVHYRVVDPELAVAREDDPGDALATVGQSALREVVGGLAFETVLDGRTDVGGRVARQVRHEADELGIEVESVEVRSVVAADEDDTPGDTADAADGDSFGATFD